MNCWVRSGSWPQFSTDFEAEPSLTMLTHSCRADWTGGRVHLGQAGPVAPEERLELPGRLLVSGGVEGHPVHRRLGQLLGVGGQLVPGRGRLEAGRGEHRLVVEQAHRVRADRVAVLLALVGALADRAGVVAAGGEAGQVVERAELAGG